MIKKFLYRYKIKKEIKNLKKEHKEIIKYYKKIVEYYENKKYKKVLNLLYEFETTYKLHIKKEMTFYKVIKKRNNLNFLKKPKKLKLNDISKEIQIFLYNYKSIKKIKSDNFLKELKNIKKLLEKRFIFEEKEIYRKYIKRLKKN